MDEQNNREQEAENQMPQKPKNLTLEDLKQGAQPPQQPARTPPALNEWWNQNSGLNLSTFGFADNFDASFPFTLPFYIDHNTRKIIEVGLTLYFQKFRGYTIPAAHTHSVTIGNHTHDVTLGNHTHSVTIGNHTHDVTVADHTHIVFEGTASTPTTPTTWTIGHFGTSGSNVTLGGTVLSSESSAAGGGQTVTSASGGGTTVSSSTASGATFGIYEDTFPADVHVLLNGVDITTNLGGVFNPIVGDNVFANLDLTGFFKKDDIGLQVLQFTTSSRGRCLPLLWVKSIITR